MQEFELEKQKALKQLPKFDESLLTTIVEEL